MLFRMKGSTEPRDDFLDKAVTPYRKLVFSFATHPTSFEGHEDYKGEVALFSYGSGFIFKNCGLLFGITAAHVIEEGAAELDTVLVTSFGPLMFRNVPVKVIREHDLAIFSIDALLSDRSNVASGLPDVPTIETNIIDQVNDAVIMGYPGDLNEVAPERGTPNLKPYSISLTRSRVEALDECSIQRPVFFRYPQKGRLGAEMPRTLLQRKGKLPRPNGMSGGPVFHVNENSSVALLGVISALDTTAFGSAVVVSQIHAAESYILGRINKRKS